MTGVSCSAIGGSLVPQRFDRIEARRPPRWVERGQERKRQRHHHHGRGLADVEIGRQPRQEVHLRRRSEEHTSELQSPCNLVCRLLLEKKKHITSQPYTHWHGDIGMEWLWGEPKEAGAMAIVAVLIGSSPFLLTT